MVKNFITKQRAAELINSIKHNRSRRDWEPIQDIISKLEDHTGKRFLFDRSYWRVEIKKGGHPWHIDTGTKNHMLWCDLSCSILLSDPKEFEGGLVHFEDRSYDPKDHYLGILIYDSKTTRHKIDPHTGSRFVLLLFLQFQS